MIAQIASLVLAAGSGGADSAAAPRWELPVVEIRADPLPDLLGPLPLATRRVTREDVARRPGGDLSDVLLPLAGLRVTSRGASWSGSGVSLRGSTGDQVVVLVDGRRRNAAQGGGVDLDGIPLESVESVEILRGGASALWGSDAVGGAIAVRTLRPRSGGWRLRAGSGSFGERSLDGSASLGAAGGWGARLSGSLFQADGNYAWDDVLRAVEQVLENGDVRRAGADLRVDGAAGDVDLRLDAGFQDSRRGVPGSAEFPTPSARLEEDLLALGARAGTRGGSWRPALDVSVLRRTKRYAEPDGAFGPVDERHRSLRLEGEVSAEHEAGGAVLRVAGGGSLDRLDSSTDGSPRRPAANVRAQAAHDVRRRGRTLRGMAAARLDAVESFAPFVSPRLGAMVEIVPGRLEARASAGLSYRAPSFDELFWPPRGTASGNPDLRAERGRDADAGLALHGLPGEGRVSVDAFVRDVDDLIQWMPGAGGIWRPHNVGRVRIAGAETEADARLPAILGIVPRVTGAAAFLDARDRTGRPNVDGKELVYRPRWTGSASLILAHRRLGELEAVWRWVDDVWVTPSNTRTLEGHALGEVRWRRDLASALALDLAVTNVTGAAARDFRDFPLPGRSWKAGVTWQRRPE